MNELRISRSILLWRILNTFSRCKPWLNLIYSRFSRNPRSYGLEIHWTLRFKGYLKGVLRFLMGFDRSTYGFWWNTYGFFILAPSINFKIGQTYILFVGQTYQNYLDSGIGAHLIYLVRFELYFKYSLWSRVHFQDQNALSKHSTDHCAKLTDVVPSRYVNRAPRTSHVIEFLNSKIQGPWLRLTDIARQTYLRT